MKALAALALLASFARAASAQPASPSVGGVVSSREWKVTRSPHKVEEFIGEVRYKAGPDRLTADWARFDHEGRLWRAKGRVSVQRLLETGERLEASGDEGRYEQRSGDGRLTGRDGVRLRRVPPEGGADEGRAGSIAWTGGRRIRLEGGLEVRGPRLEADADRGDYDREEERLLLTGGRPVLRRLGPAAPGEPDWTGALQADSIEAFRGSRRLVGEGSARGWLVLPREAAR